MKKILGIVLMVIMLVAVFTSSVYAVTEEVEQSSKYLDEFLLYLEDEYMNWEIYDYVEDQYEEVYYHYLDEDCEEPVWTLVLCELNPAPIEAKYGTLINDRVLSIVGGGCMIFEDGYGVFIKETESFVSLTQSNLDYIIENCPRFVEAIEENEIGQQLGDVDNDGCLSVVDATYIQRCLAEYDDWEMTVYDRVNLDGGNEYVYISDIDRDGERSILDATAIQKKLARIE